ncbi:MAG: hypothetical protein JW982_14385 [Spirochaetes bacterium]|nr:hypothetical protein [Spirochaetota bacterium]
MGILSRFFRKKENAFSGISFGDDFNLFDRESNVHTRFLSRYSEKDILKFFDKSGLSLFLKENGIDNYILEISIDDAMIHHMDVYSNEKREGSKIIDLRLTESRFAPSEVLRKGFLANIVYDMIVIEWLSTVNPEKKKFTKEKPQLPGQKAPSLGSLRYLMALMYHVSKESTKDGFLDVPDHIHLALMYMPQFRFLDPKNEGFIQAVKRDLRNLSLFQISMADITGCIRKKNDGMEIKFTPGEQIFPVSRRMIKYFNSSAYRLKVKEYEKIRLFVDEQELEKKTSDLLKIKKIADL